MSASDRPEAKFSNLAPACVNPAAMDCGMVSVFTDASCPAAKLFNSMAALLQDEANEKLKEMLAKLNDQNSASTGSMAYCSGGDLEKVKVVSL